MLISPPPPHLSSQEVLSEQGTQQLAVKSRLEEGAVVLRASATGTNSSVIDGRLEEVEGAWHRLNEALERRGNGESNGNLFS